MTICDRIFQIIDEKQLKTADLARLLNIKQSVLSNWKKRNTNPPIDYTLVICDFLGITVEELITGKKTKEELNEDEMKIIENYRLTDNRGKRAIMRTSEDEAEPFKNKQETLSTSRTG